MQQFLVVIHCFGVYLNFHIELASANPHSWNEHFFEATIRAKIWFGREYSLIYDCYNVQSRLYFLDKHGIELRFSIMHFASQIVYNIVIADSLFCSLPKDTKRPIPK